MDGGRHHAACQCPGMSGVSSCCRSVAHRSLSPSSSLVPESSTRNDSSVRRPQQEAAERKDAPSDALLQAQQAGRKSCTNDVTESPTTHPRKRNLTVVTSEVQVRTHEENGFPEPQSLSHEPDTLKSQQYMQEQNGWQHQNNLATSYPETAASQMVFACMHARILVRVRMHASIVCACAHRRTQRASLDPRVLTLGQDSCEPLGFEPVNFTELYPGTVVHTHTRTHKHIHTRPCFTCNSCP
jgi:hypothetical protein